MCELNNGINKDPMYLSKSKINRRMLREMHIPDCITVKEAKENFDSCKGKYYKVGLPYAVNRQRHTKFVSKYELYNKIIKGR